MTRIPIRLTLLSVFLLVSFQAHADGYLTARAKLVEAYQAGDFAAMQRAARESLDARPDYPGALFNLALAQTLDGDTTAALATLTHVTALKVDLGIDSNAAFAPLHELDGWQALAAAVATLREPVGSADVAWRGSDGHFVPEGIAVDGDAVYLGSIRNGSIVRIDNEDSRTVLESGLDSVGSIFGMRLYDDVLFFVTTATEQLAGDAGFTGSRLCSIELDSPEPVCAELPPRGDARQTLGDFVDIDGLVYASDQADGPVYVYDPAKEQWATVVEKGEFVSPQGLVADASGEHLYVADYRGGIYRVRLDGYAAPEQVEAAASLYGIDGLYRCGDWLVAVQNGITPHRVSAHRLGGDGLTVVESRILLMNHRDFDEPNLGQVVGDEFYVVANSHWNRFDRENNLPEGLSGPIVLKLKLPSD
ncbi:MAG: hypothetical protein QNJ05_05015 [Woeseiaceae bacterium]|nr:hypothetical protein [Woeseiaceae bacterium]